MSIHPMASPTVYLVSIEGSSLTVTSDCSCLLIIIDRDTISVYFVFVTVILYYYLFIYLLKDSEFFGIFYYFSSFGTILFFYYYSFFSESPFARENLRNRNAFSHQTSHTCRPSPLIVHLIFFEQIRITILDLEPNPCFQTFLIISKTYHRIFNCNTSKRRPGQELPFIFFELRAPTCL